MFRVRLVVYQICFRDRGLCLVARRGGILDYRCGPRGVQTRVTRPRRVELRPGAVFIGAPGDRVPLDVGAGTNGVGGRVLLGDIDTGGRHALRRDVAAKEVRAVAAAAGVVRRQRQRVVVPRRIIIIARSVPQAIEHVLLCLGHGRALVAERSVRHKSEIGVPAALGAPEAHHVEQSAVAVGHL